MSENPFKILRTNVVNTCGHCKIKLISEYFYAEKKLWDLTKAIRFTSGSRSV